jgi:hypothetical protein
MTYIEFVEWSLLGSLMLNFILLLLIRNKK